MLFFILITCLIDIVSTLQGEILSWSLMGGKGLNDADWECISGFAAPYVQESFREVACEAIS